MAYIDSELAKRRVREGFPHGHAENQAKSQAQPLHHAAPPSTQESSSHTTIPNGKSLDVNRQPATLGKLQEIDLGDETRDKNVERTNQARRRLDGEEVEDEATARGRKPGKVRLGPDGKPWRGRKRRGSDDIKRDKLVEEVLRENRCECLVHPGWVRDHVELTVTQWKSTMSWLWKS